MALQELPESTGVPSKPSCSRASVEPMHGQIHKVRGLRLFRLRGLEMPDGEWHLSAATHNLLTLFRFRRAQQ
ncbi:MAG: transposase [Cyanobium sp.]